ncbi:MAG: radical SAM protein [Candidatus Zixiibacteriota bacterium]
MNKGKPLYLKFSTVENKYVYDTITNKIFRVDNLVYEILDDFFALTGQELVQKHSRNHAIPLIESARTKISEKIRKDDLFFPKKPIKMKLSMEEERLFSFYDGDLEDLILNVTEQCNMRCKYCAFSGAYFYERSHQDNSMSFETAKKVVDFFRAYSRKREKVYYTFYGGEPLLSFPLIKKVVDYVKSTERDRQVYFGTTTNGTLLKDDLIDFLIQNKFLLTVSLNGPEQVHDRYRIFANGNPTFNAIISNLKRIRDKDEQYYNQNVAFNATICPPYDLAELMNFFETYDLAKGHSIRSNFVEANDTSFFDQFEQEDLDLSDGWKELNTLYMKKTVKSERVNGFISSFFEKGMMRLHQRPMLNLDGEIHLTGMCTPGVRRLFVSPEGKFHICEKIGYHLPIGDVESGFDFERIRSHLDRFISISQKDCTQCWGMRLCSACFFHAKKNNHLDEKRKREYCPVEKNYLKSLLITYCSILEKNPEAFSFLDNAVFE